VLKIVDCTSDKKRWPFRGFNAEMTGTVPWGPEDFESVVWGDIGEAMSIPHNPDEVALNYIPTQIISERLRHGGVEGIAYKSLLAQGGVNVVLFDIKDADPINFTLYETEKVSYSFEQRDNSYFAKKKPTSHGITDGLAPLSVKTQDLADRGGPDRDAPKTPSRT